MTFSRRTFRQHLAGWMTAATILATISQAAPAQEPPKNFVMHGTPKPLHAMAFEDGQNRPRSLADFKGRIVLLNIWATWCVPCRREMPALDRLQARLGGPDFEVVPVSIDRGGIEAVKRFYSEIDAQNLGMYIDSSGQLVRALGAVGLPTTLLIDGAGRELARIIGPAEWDAPEIAELLKPVILKQIDVAEGRDQHAQVDTQSDRGAAGALWRGIRWLKALFTE